MDEVLKIALAEPLPPPIPASPSAPADIEDVDDARTH
jgi:hypothetical protein